MTRSRRTLIFAAALVALAGATMNGAAPGRALPPGPPVRSASTTASFAGTTFVATAGESVDLTGALHVVTRLSGSDSSGWTLDWQVNVDNASGTGETSGADYVLTGADKGSVAFPPGPPVRTALFEPTFTLIPPGPPTHPPSPCRFLVAVSFGEAGQVTDVDVHLTDSSPPTND